MIKFIYNVVKEGARGRSYSHAIQWLIDAGLIYKVININKPAVPLSAYAETDCFKLFLLDIGLLGAMVELSPEVFLDHAKQFSHFNGSFIENYVATSLKLTNRQLYYWTSKGKAELDFIIQYHSNILPIEVKSR